MRRHAKASSAGSTSGIGSSRGLFGRAAATRGASSGEDGSGAPSYRHSILVAVFAVCVFAALLAATAVQAGTGVIGTLGITPPSRAGGHLGNPSGLAINRTGVGGVGVGDVYVVDPGASGRRVSQYTSSGAFVRSFGYDVTSAGQDNTGANEQETVTVKASKGAFSLVATTATGNGVLTSGSNTITEVYADMGAFHVGDVLTAGFVPANTRITAVGATTLTLSANVTGNNVLGQLAATENTGATGTGTYTNGSSEVTGVTTTSGAFAVGQTFTSAGGGIPAGTTITAVGAGTLTLSASATESKAAQTLTGTNIPYNATAAELKGALEALPGIGAGNLTVSRVEKSASEFEHTVTFSGGLLAHNDVVQLTSSAAGLQGGTVPVATTVPGGGPEVCAAASSPTDVCKVGSAVASAGSINEVRSIVVDQATGNIYANGSGNSRVDVFSATGTFEGAFGWNVNAASPEEKLQFCTAATGCKKGVSGNAAGQLSISNQTNGLAVDPRNGHIYVTESASEAGSPRERIGEYIPTLNGSKEVTGATFVRAFGNDVVPTINEKQTVTLSGATGGSFTLSFNGQTTEAIGLGNLTAGSNEVTGVTTSTGTFTAGMVVSGTGIPAGATVTAVNSGVLTLSAAVEAGKTANGVALTGALPYNATTAAVQSALDALSSVGKENLTVSGPAGGPWTVEFFWKTLFGSEIGKFRGEDVPQMGANGSGLSGSSPSVAVATVTQGANGTSTGLEVCTAATGCKGGNPTAGTRASLAVDSTGAIYAAGGESGFVQKYNAAATSVENFAPAQLVPGSSGSSVAATDVVVDPNTDHVFVAKKVGPESYKIFEFGSSGEFIESSPGGESGLKVGSTVTLVHGLALSPTGTLYFVHNAATNSIVQIFGPPPAPTPTVKAVTAIGTTSATFSGTVVLPGPGPAGGFPAFYHFEYSTNGVIWSKFPTNEEPALGDGSGAGSPESCPTGNPPKCNVTQTVTGLIPNTAYAVRLVANNGTQAFSSTTNFTTKAAVPAISATRAEPVSETTAHLTALLNPNNQVTTYHFEWGTDASYGTRIPADFDPVAGSGGQPIKVTADISGLNPHSLYHFRLVAENPSGTVKGPDQEFVTLDSAGLPDNRNFELVSPANKGRGGEVGRIFVDLELPYQAAENGEAFGVPLMNSVATAGGFQRFRAVRTDSGWQNTQVSSPSVVQPPKKFFLNVAQPSHVLYFSPDLTCGVVQTYNPLTADTPKIDVELGIENLYRWNSDGTYTLLTNKVPVNTGVSDAYNQNELPFRTVGSSPDCSRIYFQSIFKYTSGGTTVDEWHNGTLRDAGVLPNGATPSGEIGFGGQISAPDIGLFGDSFSSRTWRNAISEDGSRLFFTAKSNAGPDAGTNAIFKRENDGASVVDISQSTTAVPTLGARYEGASPDGSHVFFRANYGIAATSSPGPTNVSCGGAGGGSFTEIEKLSCDLYDYNVETGHLTDLTPDTNPADPIGAAVQGTVAISKHGSHVYFAAMGQLVPGKGRTYAQNATGFKSANIYLVHGGELSYVTNLTATNSSGEGDLTGGGTFSRVGGALMRDENWSAATSADGGKLLFTAAANITGYEGGNSDQQAYLYSAETGSIVCISCRPDGFPSTPSSRPIEGTYSPIANQTWRPSLFGGRPRSMSEDGNRVFFTSPNVLAPGAISGEDNVYEWEKGQVYLLTTLEKHGVSGLAQFLGASASGNDVFVGTGKQLVGQDNDLVDDVYDIRVNGGFPPPPVPPVPCVPANDECQGTPASQPAAPSIPSSQFTGPGNPPVKKAKAKKPKNHHKKHHKKAPQRQHDRATNTNRGGSK